ncbi:A/G-specific adenine glycosylase [Salinisphaera hydrothermalis]|uniref:Adenine DNA glycosylase n=1 Tax=Salinisphaera hydrothermalis (strain C41B8) TaxID=1304275 RepID=A0A084IK39_SALHC|nr:A/G-specific adenine glycosylase [Salinisphaera hydrothermalis]KEZ77073.1 A/G-specific adenine glycosylase-like protein [Salinisphaera hydrothermalis C41B8]
MKHEIPDRAPATIADDLLTWFDRHGRHDLPWQHPRTPYRVWVAEIMLQQTQVTTVIDYFQAFMARFPDVETLAAAPSDDVMAHWAGLGYYARARNLHAAAQQVVGEYDGVFPRDVETLMTLPGIGRSTAGAVVAQAFGIWAPILDGNAKRVIARLAGITAAPGSAAYEKPLWQLAERYTPHERVTDYTQAIMDLGATLCTRRRPNCPACPLAATCVACIDGLQVDIPAPRKKRARPQRETTMLVIEDEAGRLLLEKRPPTGIWGGLWSLPEIEAGADIAEVCRERFGIEAAPGSALAPIEHGFTHFLLTLHARRVQYRRTVRIMDGDFAWYRRDERPGLPAPIVRLLDSPQLKLNL